jgi:hypothetical protein
MEFVNLRGMVMGPILGMEEAVEETQGRVGLAGTILADPRAHAVSAKIDACMLGPARVRRVDYPTLARREFLMAQLVEKARPTASRRSGGSSPTASRSTVACCSC